MIYDTFVLCRINSSAFGIKLAKMNGITTTNK